VDASHRRRDHVDPTDAEILEAWGIPPLCEMLIMTSI
jgi:hypothetical protein